MSTKSRARRPYGAGAALLILLCVFASLPARSQQFDNEAPRQARQILEPTQYQSSIHRVDDAVPVVVQTYLFTLQTNWGQMKAYGYDALVLRLRELYAIQALDDVSKTDAFAQAMAKSVTAPVRMAENLVRDPGGTISAVPQGIGSFFSRIGDSLSSGGGSNDNVVQAATGSAARKRAIAVRYGVSPYSTNTVLQDKIDDLARAEGMGALLGSAATMAIPGGAGMVFSLGRTSENMMSLLRDRTPAELREMNYDILRGLGIPVDDVRNFLANPSYNPGVQTHFSQSLNVLTGTRQLESFVRLANGAHGVDDAFLYQRIAQMMAGYVRSVEPFDNVGVIHGLPVAMTRNRDVVLFAPVDDLLWTPRSSETTAAFEQIVNPLKPREKHLWISGQASTLMKAQLTAKGWTLHENARGKLYDIM